MTIEQNMAKRKREKRHTYTQARGKYSLAAKTEGGTVVATVVQY